ncbi:MULTISPECIES: ABC transporter ATP-binding protein [Paenibacillus]|uniref:ABC transporter related protein n=2 Tax=Paenibacillus lactis TaxID=228574 RepID=G4HCI9_9BACL|nr:MULTISPECIES: ABC transporter ATP-binding protein [Paenibacillus]EHB65765.1 ABC transporter related protein [Paenibacillus lactis 154]MBP1891148.1 ATP-binding cassette subfamily B protein [Paenibacillus lactis]MCM3493602.1 ABC transporter ATP-binding protein/permease [Paenibacillus lactis]GIO93042.1 multidrug ABC transporter ATP-binding protein [Paenibacillus lactis]HAF98477.1 ABC transporter ATP-binding protein [Paenibacillus lactis]
MLKLFRYMRPYRTAVLLVLLFTFFQCLSDLYLPTLMADIVDKGITLGNVPYIWRVGGVMLLVASGGMVCAIAASYLASKAASGFGRIVRGRVFSHVENFTLQEFDKIGTASLITRTTNDITQVQQVTIMILRMMAIAPMMCIGGIVMAISRDPGLTTVLLAVLPILALAIFLIAKQGIPLFKAIQVKIDTLSRVVRENLTGIRVIRSFNRAAHETVRFNDANEDLTATSIKVNKIMGAMMPVMMLVMNFATIAIVWFGAHRINDAHMKVGDLMAFLQYAMMIMFSLIMLSVMFVMIPRAQASAVRINEVLHMQPDIHDPKEPGKPGLQKAAVEFQDVTFFYPGAEEPAVSNLSFRTGPGEVTAIIGGTGSGKSTLISLIPRFYDVTSGRILVNGTDIREMRQEELRQRIGFVPQKALLFTGSIADNIRYGKEDATDEEIRHAAKVAQAADFIEAMEGAYDAEISQGGSNVSGGQKQRLSIARALVRRPEIYIFDDSFSALDFKTDAKLRAALREETGDATVLIVAQRVSTVMDADRIIVLDEGRIAGMGTHEELMNTSEVYREIVISQLSEEEIA